MKTKQIRLNLEMYAQVFKLLIAEPCTPQEIVEETGIHLVTAQRLLRCFHKYKLVHISAWETDGMGRDTTKVYKWGKGINVARRRMTDAEKARRCRKKKAMRALTNVLHGEQV